MNNQLVTTINEVEIYIKREDLLHPFISGNKFRKLKYNLEEASKLQKKIIITFGGAFSNHIAATAFAAKINNFKSIGIIRGEELENKIASNPTLKFASQNGMKFIFVSRNDYKNKENLIDKLFTINDLENFYIIPEGGTNELAIKGCKEILTPYDSIFDYITTSIGTAGTILGLIESALSHQKILGFPALKENFLENEINKFTVKQNWALMQNYHFEGYGKVNDELIDFLNQFYKNYNIPLDPIYTGKMVFGIFDLIQQNYFPKKTKILMIHTGGLQGIQGMNLVLKQKNKNIIEY